jgi:hypothetical protein
MGPLRRWRLNRAELKLADLRYYVGKWGWSHKPSDDAYYERRVRRAERKVRRLGGDPG